MPTPFLFVPVTPGVSLKRYTIFFLSVLLAGCAAAPQKVVNSTEFVRGMVSYFDGFYYVDTCYTQDRTQLADPDGLLQRHFPAVNQEQAPPIYMEIGGQRDSDGRWLVQEMHVAGGSRDACKHELHSIDLRAAGEPEWVADLVGDRLQIQVMDQLALLSLDVEYFRDPRFGDEWKGELRNKLGKHYDVELTVRRQPCEDQYQVWYGLTATLLVNDQLYKGCARRGSLAARSLHGIYSNELPTGDQPGVFVVLELRSEGQLLLTYDYRNGQPLIIQRGNWQLTESGRVMLNVAEQDGRAEQKVMLFSRPATGGLELEGFDSLFGRQGVTLYPAGRSLLSNTVLH